LYILYGQPIEGITGIDGKKGIGKGKKQKHKRGEDPKKGGKGRKEGR